jgi:hypothetical protein
MNREEKQQISAMKKLITEQLLARLTDHDKPPKASTISTAIVWVKALDRDLGVSTPEEIRQSLETVGRTFTLPEGLKSRLPFPPKKSTNEEKEADL